MAWYRALHPPAADPANASRDSPPAADAGKTIMVRQCRTIRRVKLFTRQFISEASRLLNYADGTGIPAILSWILPRLSRVVKNRVFQSSPPQAMLVVAGAPWAMIPRVSSLDSNSFYFWASLVAAASRALRSISNSWREGRVRNPPPPGIVRRYCCSIIMVGFPSMSSIRPSAQVCEEA